MEVYFITKVHVLMNAIPCFVEIRNKHADSETSSE